MAWQLTKEQMKKMPQSGQAGKAGKDRRVAEEDDLNSLMSMQSGAGGRQAPFVTSAGNTKGKGKGKEGEEEVWQESKVLELAVMLLLQNSLRLKDLEASYIYCHIIKVDHPALLAAQAAWGGLHGSSGGRREGPWAWPPLRARGARGDTGADHVRVQGGAHASGGDYQGLHNAGGDHGPGADGGRDRPLQGPQGI
mmetsp:Transcript_69847/g.197925  ORF Transcript_69847/g.197925 Transcript_69847/m.197925 type:complete len:195 (+) Transcript_69847:362-946(+)